MSNKHPSATKAEQDILLPPPNADPEPVIFEAITAELIQKLSKEGHGSGGPTQLDSDNWRHMTNSNVFMPHSINLCQAVADMTKRLATEHVDQICLREFTSSRLIALDKNPGVRPIGVNEIMRRISSKAVLSTIGIDIQNACGPTQTCTGLRSGVEAAIHAVRKSFDEVSTEAMLIVDAENAFNSVNREAALNNVQSICPSFYRFLHNMYQEPAKLLIAGAPNKQHIWSEEGTTQGDGCGMPMYSCSVKPLMDELSHTLTEDDILQALQAWFADDSACVGKLVALRRWWDILFISGPKYGYFPKPPKCHIIVKTTDMLLRAQELFEGTGINITCEGERHLGAVVGSPDFKREFVTTKVTNWVKDVEALTKISEEEPQAAYAGFCKGLQHRWTFTQRTIPGIAELFRPLEEVIRGKFLPALLGREINDIERRIFALPVRYGGLGIPDPTNTSDNAFADSEEICRPLTELIGRQSANLADLNQEMVAEIIKGVKQRKESVLKEELQQVLLLLDESKQKALELASEKGASSWLSALPLKQMGYLLNKQEFRDSLLLRYGLQIPHTPLYCGCGSPNSLNHTLVCMKGGYVSMRHNNLRDMEATFLREACRDVKTEPPLLPTTAENLQTASGEPPSRARLDISAVGLWSTFERTFLDIRVTHPTSPSYAGISTSTLYRQHENEKKRKYQQRVIDIEKGSFTPVVFTTSGGCGPEADRFHKRVAKLISDKRKEKYSDVVRYMRTRLSFALLKSILISLRGVRGRSPSSRTETTNNISFNLVPYSNDDHHLDN